MAALSARKLGWVGWTEAVLGHLTTRLLLSFAIIISLIPHEWMHANDAWFAVVFLPEFVARVVVACRKEASGSDVDALEGEGWQLPTSTNALLLLVDFVALLSFMPWTDHTARWLRLFRLSRTVMLLRYWAPLVQDLWSVLRRRERARQLTLMMASVAMISFAGTVLLNHATDTVGEDFDGDGVVGDEHDHMFWVRMYWALRQIEDPGNMLTSPHEMATLVISIGLTFCGLFLISVLIGVGTDAVAELMSLSRLRSSGLKRHTVLVNITPATRKLLYEVMAEYRKLIPEGLRLLTPRWFAELRRNARQQREFVVVGRSAEPPDFLRERSLGRVIYRENSDEDDEAFLDRADVPVARRVVLLADVDSDEPDDETVRTLITIVERLREVVDSDDSARTSLIAEILDESNIGAARKAIARAGDQVDAHLVPTERLLALFTYSIARRPRSFKLLLSLLSSSRHEIYSHDYRRADGDAGVPKMPSPFEAMEQLYWRGLSRPPNRRLLPLGILVAERGASVSDEPRVALNPSAQMQSLEGDETFAGFVALAPNSRVALDFADEVLAMPTTETPAAPSGSFEVPHYEIVPAQALRKVLLCGFRPATVSLLEAIAATDPAVEILLLVESEQARVDAIDALHGHTNLVRTGLLDGLRGTFELVPGSTTQFRCQRHDNTELAPTGRIVIEIGDWTSSRQLLRLPAEFGSAVDVNLIVLSSSRRHGSDAATATALMKLEHLQDHLGARAGVKKQQTVIAEVINADLAHRLERRYAAMKREDIIVFSIHELRAFFMFQSVVVPSFTRVYGELMAPWGQSFVRLQMSGGVGSCSFSQLAAVLHSGGKTLVAIEVRNPAGERELYVAQGVPDQGDMIELSQLDSVWVLRAEASTKTSRYATLEGIVEPPAVSPS